jgi:hypothetical protein
MISMNPYYVKHDDPNIRIKICAKTVRFWTKTEWTGWRYYTTLALPLTESHALSLVKKYALPAEMGLTLQGKSVPAKKWNIFWSPEGRVIATVEAKTAVEAKKKTPKPYKKFMGEIYVEEVIL